MELSSTNLFPKSFNSDFRSMLKHEFTEYIEAGGRGSCKSSFLSIAIIILLLQNKDFNALVLRKVSNTLRDSVYTQLKWAAEKLGVLDDFNFTLAPLQATYKKTGQTIFFRGADDPLKIKSIKPERGYIAITWFEEWAEFTASDTETIKLSSMRGGDKFYIFESFNPPSSVRSWVNYEINSARSNRLVHKSTYLDVPAEWLGDAFIFEAEELKKSNERSYRNIFLGEPTGTGSNIFENIELRTLSDEEIEKFDYIYEGMDFGFYPDPFRWVRMSYSQKDKTLYILDELTLYKHGNYEASEKLREYRSQKKYDDEQKIIGDSAEPKSIADFRSYGWNLRGAVKGRGSLDAGFKWLQSLKKIVIDPQRCPASADEFSLYEYEIDKRTGEIMTGYPQGQSDHSMAAVRYALEEVWRKKGN